MEEQSTRVRPTLLCLVSRNSLNPARECQTGFPALQAVFVARVWPWRFSRGEVEEVRWIAATYMRSRLLHVAILLLNAMGVLW